MSNTNKEITKKNQLIDYIASGFKPKENFKVGLEFESFLINKKYMETLPYYHGYGLQRPSIRSILRKFDHKKWKDVNEKHSTNTIGLQSDIGNISLEPAGQFEYSSIPTKNLHELNKFTNEYFDELLPILQKQEVGIYNLGINPKFSLSELPLMPKERYEIMNNYMPRVGSMGRNMMRQTCTLQTNLDYKDEADLIKKIRVSMALQPLVGALFANSPIFEGKLTGDLSHRIRVWQNTDKDRSGLLKSVFNDDFNIEKYVDYAIMLPIYFLYRDSKYINIPHITFKDYMNGKYKFNNLTPIVDDFETHLSTVFPDIRLKTYLETRLADCPDKDYLITLSALFVGILYDDNALDSVYSVIKSWSYEELTQLKTDVITQGLNATFKDKKLIDITKEILAISKEGLTARGLGEEIYLSPLENLVIKGKTLAESKIELFENLGQNVDDFINAIIMK